jgi:hypothetical protein
MAQAKPVGDVGDGGFHAVGGPGNLEQKLMLLGLQAGLSGGLFAEVQEAAESVAEFRQGLKAVVVGWIGVKHSEEIISYYDAFWSNQVFCDEAATKGAR